MKAIKTLAAAALLFTAAASTANAQNYMFDNPENRTYFGIRAGIDVCSTNNGGPLYSSKPGFSAGIVYDIPLWKNLYFEPGLSLFYNVFGTYTTQTQKVVWTDPEGNENSRDVPFAVDGSLRNFGFRLPLNLGYHFDFAPDLSVHVFTGFQLNLSVVARYHQNDVIEPDGTRVASESVSAFGTGGFKHADIQWNFGAGITYGRYYMSVGGSVGCTQMKEASVIAAGPYEAKLNRNMHRNTINISVGYNF